MEEKNEFQTKGDHSFISPIRCSHPDAVKWNGRYQTDGPYRQKGHPSQLLQQFAHLGVKIAGLERPIHQCRQGILADA